MPIQFTDAERRFADSPEGVAAIARARHLHDAGQAYLGAAATPWTDAMSQATIRHLATDRARSDLASARAAIVMGGVDTISQKVFLDDSRRRRAANVESLHRHQVGGA
jgi:hypothetical protein